jgi:predicted secreted protein
MKGKWRLVLGSAVAALLALSVVACNSSAAASSVAPTAPAPSTRTMTLADDGHTLTLHAGQSFLLKLGEGYDWNVTVSDQSVVSRKVNVLTVRGAQGIYDAHKAGTTTLTATGDPVCRNANPPCAQASRQFHIQIIVQ